MSCFSLPSGASPDLAAAATDAGLAAHAGAATDPLPAPMRELGRGDTRLILLGQQGGPGSEPEFDDPEAFGTAHLLCVGDRAYMIDAGKGALMALQRIGLPRNGLTGSGDTAHIFITHLHSDHVFDLGGVLYHEWETQATSERPVTMHAHGPAPLRELTDAAYAYFRPGNAYASAAGALAWPSEAVVAHEFTAGAIGAAQPFAVFEDDRVKVTAVGVIHPPLATVAYRFDTEDLSVTLSGDTAFSPALIGLAAGSDLLVHEAFHRPTIERLFPPVGEDEHGFAAYLDQVHTSADDVGRVARDAGVRRLLLGHVYPSSPRLVSPADWEREVRRHYDGELVVGRSLTVVS